MAGPTTTPSKYGSPNRLDVRRYWISPAEEVDQPRMIHRPWELLKAIEDGREKEPRQEEDADQVFDVSEEDVRRREQPRDAER